MRAKCSQYFLHSLMDIGSLSRTVSGTMLNYKRDPYVHARGPDEFTNPQPLYYQPCKSRAIVMEFLPRGIG